MRLLTLLFVLGLFVASPFEVVAGDNNLPTQEELESMWNQAVAYSKTLVDEIRRADYKPHVIDLNNMANFHKTIALMIAALPKQERNTLLARDNVPQNMSYLAETVTSHWEGGLVSNHLDKVLFKSANIGVSFF